MKQNIFYENDESFSTQFAIIFAMLSTIYVFPLPGGPQIINDNLPFLGFISNEPLSRRSIIGLTISSSIYDNRSVPLFQFFVFKIFCIYS